MFCRATIRLGISPHSSLCIICSYVAEFKLRFYVLLDKHWSKLFIYRGSAALQTVSTDIHETSQRDAALALLEALT